VPGPRSAALLAASLGLALACVRPPAQLPEPEPEVSDAPSSGAPVETEAAKSDDDDELALATRCHEGERSYFECPLTTGETVLLCGSPDLKAADAYLQYRRGPSQGAPLVIWPEPGAVEEFFYMEVRTVRSLGDAVSFALQGHRHVLEERSGSGHPGEGAANNFVGVRVFDQRDALVDQISCAEGWSSELGALAGVLEQIDPWY
jgi:hypothetical protein